MTPDQRLRQLIGLEPGRPTRDHHNHSQMLHLVMELEKAKAVSAKAMLEPRLGVHLRLQ